jgi:hypothetical protein
MLTEDSLRRFHDATAKFGAARRVNIQRINISLGLNVWSATVQVERFSGKTEDHLMGLPEIGHFDYEVGWTSDQG